MTLDYRGFGDSEGDATFFDPMDQVADIRAALTYPRRRATTVDELRLGLFGSGGTGGGNAVIAAGLDERVKATVSQVPVADGESLAAAHASRVRVDRVPRRGREAQPCLRRQRGTRLGRRPATASWCPRPERAKTNVKKDVDGRVPDQVALHCAESVLRLPPARLRRGHRSASADAHQRRERRGHAGGPRPRPLRRGRWPQAPARPDRHHPLRGLRPVPRHREPAHRGVVRAIPRPTARSRCHEQGDEVQGVTYLDRPGDIAPNATTEAAHDGSTLLIRGGTVVSAERAGSPRTSPSSVGASPPFSTRAPTARPPASSRPRVKPSAAWRGRCALPPSRARFHAQGRHHQRHLRLCCRWRHDLLRDAQRRATAQHARAARGMLELYGQKAIVDWNVNAAGTVPEHLAEMATMGIAAFKVFMVVDTGRDYPAHAGHRRPPPRQAAGDLRDRRPTPAAS